MMKVCWSEGGFNGGGSGFIHEVTSHTRPFNSCETGPDEKQTPAAPRQIQTADCSPLSPPGLQAVDTLLLIASPTPLAVLMAPNCCLISRNCTLKSQSEIQSAATQ